MKVLRSIRGFFQSLSRLGKAIVKVAEIAEKLGCIAPLLERVDKQILVLAATSRKIDGIDKLIMEQYGVIAGTQGKLLAELMMKFENLPCPENCQRLVELEKKVNQIYKLISIDEQGINITPTQETIPRAGKSDKPIRNEGSPGYW